MLEHIDSFFSLLEAGKEITMEVQSTIFRGKYAVEVLVVDPINYRLRISMPMVEGKVILIPVGTILSLSIEESSIEPIELKLIERIGGSARSLVLGPLEDLKSRREEYLSSKMKIFSVSSGKGGVGKTTFAVNIAIALAKKGFKVCILDGDLGTANVDVVLNLGSRYNLSHVIGGECSILDVLVEGPCGICVLPGGSGLQELTELDEDYFRLVSQFRNLDEYLDFLIVDTTSGLFKIVTNFIIAARNGVIVTTPEPHAITDAYALIKVLANYGTELDLKIVVNRVKDEKEALDVSKKIRFAAKHFLQLDVDFAGFIVEDDNVWRSVRKQEAFVLSAPNCLASRCIEVIAAKICGEPPEEIAESRLGFAGFFERIKNVFATR